MRAGRGSDDLLPGGQWPTPFAYLQCYRNADYPQWAEIIGVTDGISVDLYIR